MDHGLKCKTIKVLEQNIREKLWDLGLGEEFLDVKEKHIP